MKDTPTIWDFKGKRSITKDQVRNYINLLTKDYDTLQTTIKSCKRTQIADHIRDMQTEQVILNELGRDLAYYKALQDETN